jgi:hypothetical protein
VLMSGEICSFSSVMLWSADLEEAIQGTKANKKLFCLLMQVIFIYSFCKLCPRIAILVGTFPYLHIMNLFPTYNNNNNKAFNLK